MIGTVYSRLFLLQADEDDVEFIDDSELTNKFEIYANYQEMLAKEKLQEEARKRLQVFLDDEAVQEGINKRQEKVLQKRCCINSVVLNVFFKLFIVESVLLVCNRIALQKNVQKAESVYKEEEAMAKKEVSKRIIEDRLQRLQKKEAAVNKGVTKDISAAEITLDVNTQASTPAPSFNMAAPLLEVAEGENIDAPTVEGGEQSGVATGDEEIEVVQDEEGTSNLIILLIFLCAIDFNVLYL